MRFYLWLNDRTSPRTAVEKVAWSACLAVFAPLAIITILWLSAGDSASPTALVFAALLVGSLAAICLVAFVRPLIDLTRLATRQLDDYLLQRRLPEAPLLPPDDELGLLL